MRNYIVFFIPIFLFFLLGLALSKEKIIVEKKYSSGNSKILYDATFKNERDKYSEVLNLDKFETPPVAFSKKPSVLARNAYFVEINSQKSIYTKGILEKVPIASLVKVMTAVVALEHLDSNANVKISKHASSIGENTMGLTQGETYTLEELLYGLILHSGNDAAVAIAEGTAGTVETFVNWMNYKAEDLGLTSTLFTDPNGLNLDDKSYYSSAYDLVLLTEYSLKKPLLREIYKTVEYEILNEDGRHKYLYLYNQTNLLTTYPGVMGIKTGYTEEAGLCLITYAENEGKKILGVILGSTDRKGDAILLLDYSFELYGIEVEHNLL